MYLLKGDWSSTSRVSPFGYQGIYACLRLPLAFRSLPRPSSALGALASTLCSSSLDYVDPETRYIYFRLLSNLFLCNWSFKTFSRLSSLCSCQGAWVISHPPLPILSFGLGLSLPFGILKTIQMIEQQLFLTSRFRAFLCPVCTGLSLLRFSLSAYFAIDLGLKVPLSLRLTPKKGGDPAAPSDTATLLRLHPSH